MWLIEGERRGLFKQQTEVTIPSSLGLTMVSWSNGTQQLKSRKVHRMSDAVYCVMVTKNKKTALCGLRNGKAELRSLNDLSLLSSLRIHSSISCGSFVSGSYSHELKRWDDKGTVHNAFSGHSMWIVDVMELRSNVIVNASGDSTLRMWNVSSGECHLSAFKSTIILISIIRDK